ncbi:MAG: OmpW family outer membrane protein [Burkholderiales bacterium]
MHNVRAFSCRLVAVLIVAALTAPAFGQPQSSTVVGCAPGTASAARLVTASATVTAIDTTTRQVTLRRADGSTFTVVAGPDVQNLHQVRVGDTVTIDFYDTLTLDLKKGGTGAPASRTDAAGAARELGQRPGGIATRETVIVADVIAMNAAAQTVSLRGPGGRVVNLPIRDPEQFRRISVGDQVEATYVEAFALSIKPAATPAAAPAPAMAPVAAPWGRWMLGARVLNINPDVSSSVSGFEVQDQWTGEFDATYFFTPSLAVEGAITWAKQNVSFNGNGLGSLKMMPVIFTLQYHFTDLAANNPAFLNFKPYVGGGFKYTYFYETDLGNNSGASVNNDSWGGALQAGFDYQFQPRWNFNVDVKYLWIDNDVRLNATGTNASSLDLDPWVFGVGVRYRF